MIYLIITTFNKRLFMEAMMNFILGITLLLSFSLSAERPWRTPKELLEEADEVCMGTIANIESTKTCYNESCTNYQLNYVATMNDAACLSGNKSVLNAGYFKIVYNEGFPP